jgi:hypothetical protein
VVGGVVAVTIAEHNKQGALLDVDPIEQRQQDENRPSREA